MSVFVIDKIRRAAFKPYKGQQTRGKDRNIRRCIVRGRRGTISDSGNSSGSQSTSNVVLSETGYNVTVNNGGGVYHLQRGGERCKLDSTIPERVTTNDTDAISTNTIYRQRSSQQALKKSHLPPPYSPHRSQIPLCSSGIQMWESGNYGHQWEELASGPTHETFTNEFPQAWKEKIGLIPPARNKSRLDNTK
jgi:hypothetical protein